MVTDADLRARLKAARTTFTAMQAEAADVADTNLEFADQLLYESEEYLMGEVINLFNELDEEDVDWGMVKRDELAESMRDAFYSCDGFNYKPGRDVPLTDDWRAVADRAIEILLEGGDLD